MVDFRLMKSRLKALQRKNTGTNHNQAGPLLSISLTHDFQVGIIQPMRRNLFLYLALACLVGLIAIFIVDGYLGIYDTVYITSGEQLWKVEADAWLHGGVVYAPQPVSAPYPVEYTGEPSKGAYYLSANRDDKTSFRYEVDNRQFSDYKTDTEVSVWHSQQKVRDLLSQPMSIAAFEKGKLEWTIDNTELLPSGIPPEQSYQYSVIIKRGEIERRIIVSINPIASPVKY